MKRSSYLAISVLIATFLVLASTAPVTSGQNRMSDKDIESLMKNLGQDAKKFRSVFNSAVHKSTIRKTSQEKDAKNLVTRFQQQIDGMLNQFRNSKRADQTLPAVVSSADQIDKLVSTTPMGDETNTAWAKVKAGLSTLSQQFGMTATQSQ